jgi:plastocyanin
MGNKAIKILVEDNGDITYIPALAHVKAGDSIDWGCEGGAFMIRFSGVSPFSSHTLSSKEQHIQVKVDPNARPGIYDYACVVTAKDRIHLDAGCPSIIID